MAQPAVRDPVVQRLMTGVFRRWRTVVALAAGLLIMAIMIALGWFDRDADSGIEWAHVAVYLSAVVVAAMQVDRLFHP